MCDEKVFMNEGGQNYKLFLKAPRLLSMMISQNFNVPDSFGIQQKKIHKDFQSFK